MALNLDFSIVFEPLDWASAVVAGQVTEAWELPYGAIDFHGQCLAEWVPTIPELSDLECSQLLVAILDNLVSFRHWAGAEVGLAAKACDWPEYRPGDCDPLSYRNGPDSL
jgi:hypothetical protein